MIDPKVFSRDPFLEKVVAAFGAAEHRIKAIMAENSAFFNRVGASPYPPDDNSFTLMVNECDMVVCLTILDDGRIGNHYAETYLVNADGTCTEKIYHDSIHSFREEVCRRV